MSSFTDDVNLDDGTSWSHEQRTCDHWFHFRLDTNQFRRTIFDFDNIQWRTSSSSTFHCSTTGSRYNKYFCLTILWTVIDLSVMSTLITNPIFSQTLFIGRLDSFIHRVHQIKIFSANRCSQLNLSPRSGWIRERRRFLSDKSSSIQRSVQREKRRLRQSTMFNEFSVETSSIFIVALSVVNAVENCRFQTIVVSRFCFHKFIDD